QKPPHLVRLRAAGAGLRLQRAAPVVPQHSRVPNRGGPERPASRPSVERHGLHAHVRLLRGGRLLLPAPSGPALLPLVLLPADAPGGSTGDGTGLPARGDADVPL